MFYNKKKLISSNFHPNASARKKENMSNFFEVDPIVGSSNAHTENIFPFPEPSLYMDLHTDAIS